MKLSKDTLTLIKSFTGVNTDIVFNSGSEISAASEAGDIFVKADIQETFPETDIDMAVYDVPTFLNVLNMFDDPEIEFKREDENDETSDGYAKLSGGSNSYNFFFTDSEMINHGKWVPLKEEDYHLDFDLTNDDIINIQRASASGGLDQMEFLNESGRLVCNLIEKTGANKNKYKIDLGACDVSDFKLVLRVAENFRLFPGDYAIRIAKWKTTMIMCASNKDKTLNYQIAMDNKSFFNVQ